MRIIKITLIIITAVAITVNMADYCKNCFVNNNDNCESIEKINNLVTFSSFVQWPSERNAKQRKIIIGMYCDNSFYKQIDSVIKVRNRIQKKYILKKCKTLSDAELCNILFIAKSEDGRIQSILQKINQLPILSVSDAENFCERGGMIKLYRQNKSVGFEINLDAAQQVGLSISSQMLQIAPRLFRCKGKKE